MDKVIVIRHSNKENVSDNKESYIKKHGKHFTNKLAEYASRQMINANGTNHRWDAEAMQRNLSASGYTIPDTSTIGDIAYTANMAYADFFPDLITEQQCIKYAMLIANDPDGYEGIQFSRWIADIEGKGEKFDFADFV